MPIIDDLHDINEIFDLYLRFQPLDCVRKFQRCFKRTHKLSEEPTCRFPPYPPSNDMWLKTIPQKYSKEAITILKKLHLITFIDEFNYQPNKELACQKYKYPSTKGEHIMLNLAEMFALTLSSGNVKIITENFCSKYLDKYAAGKEEHADVKIKQGSDEEHFSVTAPKLSNNKITGSALFRKSEIEKHEGNVVSALQVSLTEYLWWMFQLPAIITNIAFIHVPSVSLDYRGGKYFRKRRVYVRSSGSANDHLNVREQLGLPSYLCFTQQQKVQIEDASASHFSTDKFTLFSIRPPELMFIRQLQPYYSFLIRDKCLKREVVTSYLSRNPRPWIDGSNTVIKIRSTALAELRLIG